MCKAWDEKPLYLQSVLRVSLCLVIRISVEVLKSFGEEIDALGGEMGKVIDKTFIQSKMLNKSKGLLSIP